MAVTMVEKLEENNAINKNTVFILPVGPRRQYSRFARICNMKNVKCNNLITINMDEYLDENNNYISERNPFSYRKFMKEELFNLLNNNIKIKPENIFFPDPKNIYEIGKIIDEIGKVDICFGGVGINGHIAFNEPQMDDEITLDKFKSLKTRILNLSKETIIMNSLKYGGCIDLVPKRCVTIGIREILMANELRFYLEHTWQSMVFRKIILDDPSVSFPVTIIVN